MTDFYQRRPDSAPRRTERPRHDGEWGFGSSVLSLIILGAHYLWWDRRLRGELDPVWADELSPALDAALRTITSATTIISVVAAILVVVVPAVTWWALRRSPGWPPLVITTIALLTTWIVTHPSTMVLRHPGV